MNGSLYVLNTRGMTGAATGDQGPHTSAVPPPKSPPPTHTDYKGNQMDSIYTGVKTACTHKIVFIGYVDQVHFISIPNLAAYCHHASMHLHLPKCPSDLFPCRTMCSSRMDREPKVFIQCTCNKAEDSRGCGEGRGLTMVIILCKANMVCCLIPLQR